MNPQEYLEQRLDDQIAWYDAKSRSNQHAYKRLRVFEIVAAGAIPVLTGAKLGDHGGLVIGVLGAAIAVCSGVSTLFKFHELWIEYRGIAETLRHHKYLYVTRSRPYHDANAFALLVETAEGVMSKQNSGWSELQRQRQSNTPAPAEAGLSAAS